MLIFTYNITEKLQYTTKFREIDIQMLIYKRYDVREFHTTLQVNVTQFPHMKVFKMSSLKEFLQWCRNVYLLINSFSL